MSINEEIPEIVKLLLNTELYTVEKFVGGGLTSKVYLIKNTMGQYFAAKVIDLSQLSKPIKDYYLPTELSIHSSIKHPNIIELIKIIKHNDDYLILILEYANNGELSSYVGKIELSLIKHWFMQILEAIKYLHQNGIELNEFN